MNGIETNEYELKFNQTAKGVFYIYKVGVKATTAEKVLSETTKLMEKSVEMLKKLNSEEDPKK